MTVLRRTTVRLTPADQAANRYPAFPFEVPPDARSIGVSMEVDRADGRACIDLGLLGPDGLRGWSGGARTSYVVERDDATPGYRPGLGAGDWAVLLGLHQVSAEGVDVTITVVCPARERPDHGPRQAPVQRLLRGSDRGLPAPRGLTWYAGDPHNHCLHSDGELSLWELANEGVRSGLDYLGCTDHNTTSHHPHLASVSRSHGITLIPGQEMTTHRGHANAWGEIGVIDFRDEAGTWVEQVERRGGFMSINHPVADDCAWLHPLERMPPGAELFHGTWYRNLADTSILAWAAMLPDAVVVLGGGDFHNRSTPLRPGMPTTWIAAEECSAPALIEAMAAGRTMVTGSARRVSEDEARPVLLDSPALVRLGGVDGHRDEDLMAVDAAGTVLVDRFGARLVIEQDHQVVRAPADKGPYRLETAARWVVALSA